MLQGLRGELNRLAIKPGRANTAMAEISRVEEQRLVLPLIVTLEGQEAAAKVAMAYNRGLVSLKDAREIIKDLK